MNYFISRQRYADNKLSVEIACGNVCNDSYLPPKYGVGRGTTGYKTLNEAIDVAVRVIRAWSVDTDEPVHLSYLYPVGANGMTSYSCDFYTEANLRKIANIVKPQCVHCNKELDKFGSMDFEGIRVCSFACGEELTKNAVRAYVKGKP